MKRREPQLSGKGILLVTIGSVLGLGLWLVGIFTLSNPVTHLDLDALGPPTVDPNVNVGATSTASSGNASGEGSAMSTSGTTATTGTTGTGGGTKTYSSGGFTGLAFPVSNPANTKLMATTLPGYTIFQNQCSVCHGTGLLGSVGPELLGIGNVSTEPKLLAAVTHGFPPLMPPAGGLTDPTQIKEVVAWLSQQKQK